MMSKKSSKKKVHCIILAAGMGTRMISNQSKVLHCVSGMSMVQIVLNIARKISNSITVIASEENCGDIKKMLSNDEDIVIQKERFGTGHAVLVAFESIKQSIAEKMLILYGDTPLVTEETLQKVTESVKDATFLGFYEHNIHNKYGRLVVNDDNLLKIIEYKDANLEERNINICNAGIICVDKHLLLGFLQDMKPSKITGEYYLTDIAEYVGTKGRSCGYILCDQSEVLGVNSRNELASVDGIMQERIKHKLMQNGVTILLPHTTYIHINASIGKDVIIEPNCFIGENVTVEEGVVIRAFSYLDGCLIKSGASVGPFARIRPYSIINKGARVGNFVEVKNSIIEDNSKMSHLSYIGDVHIQENCNIGAGTIFCNYDGFNKFKTTVGNDVFIGSNSTIISPVDIADGSIIGAGSVVSKSTTKDDLVIARAEQQNITCGAVKFRNKRK